MKNDYRLVAVRHKGIILLDHPQYNQQVWTIVRCRTHKRCVVTGEDLYKKEAWSPLTNGNNRMQRISMSGMASIVNEPPTNYEESLP